jgi:hypothetical protein
MTIEKTRMKEGYYLPTMVAVALNTNRPEMINMVIESIEYGHSCDLDMQMGLLLLIQDLLQDRAKFEQETLQEIKDTLKKANQNLQGALNQYQELEEKLGR